VDLWWRELDKNDWVWRCQRVIYIKMEIRAVGVKAVKERW
jgi:hypothetical protein